MKLIYAWIEEFRNVKQCGFSFSPEYSVELSIHGSISIDGKDYTLLSVDNIIKKDCYNIFANDSNNVDCVTVIAGKNGVGKSNLILVLSDLRSAYDNSKFVYIYAGDNGDFVLECNQVSVLDFHGNRHDSIQERFQPHTAIYKMNFADREFVHIVPDDFILKDVEYVLVKEETNSMTYPNANNLYSYIGRFGLEHKKSGIFYKLKYFIENIGRATDVVTKYFELNFTIDKDWRFRENKTVSLLPELYPEEEFLFDLYGKSELYKPAFLLRLFETKLSETRFINDASVKSYIDDLKNIAIKHNGNVEGLYRVFDKMLAMMCDIHKTLKEKNMINHTDTDLCIVKFYACMKAFIKLVPMECFENSYHLKIGFDNIRSDERLLNAAYELLGLMNNSDVCLDYNPILDVRLKNLPDGMETLSNIYATVHKCLLQNNHKEYKRIILVLDEPDTHLHPEWSRRFISDLIEFLNNEFCDNKFQVILTTHSPFLLSDVPKQNVILLKVTEDGYCYSCEDGDDVATFGQNIHKLFRVGFFMDSTYGEFAKTKINELFAALQPNMDDTCINKEYPSEDEVLAALNLTSISEVEQRIEMIGETIIKDKLYDMLYMCIHNGFDTSQHKKRLEHRIEKLQNKLKEFGGE